MKHFQEIAGKLQRASFLIPVGKGLFSLIQRTIKTTEAYIKITPYLVVALKYLSTLVQHLAENTRPVQILVRKYPYYL